MCLLCAPHCREWQAAISAPPDRLRHEILPLCGQMYLVVVEVSSPAFLKRKLCIVLPDCDVGQLLAVLCQPCVDCLPAPGTPSTA